MKVQLKKRDSWISLFWFQWSAELRCIQATHAWTWAHAVEMWLIVAWSVHTAIPTLYGTLWAQTSGWSVAWAQACKTVHIYRGTQDTAWTLDVPLELASQIKTKCVAEWSVPWQTSQCNAGASIKWLIWGNRRTCREICHLTCHKFCTYSCGKELRPPW